MFILNQHKDYVLRTDKLADHTHDIILIFLFW